MPGYMVLPSVRFKDVRAAVKFYTETLGFALVRGSGDEDNNSVKFGDATMMLEGDGAFYSNEYNAAIRSRMGGKSPNAFYIEAEDLEGLYKTLNERKVTIVDPLAAREWGQREFTCEDIEGNWLTFWQAP